MDLKSGVPPPTKALPMTGKTDQQSQSTGNRPSLRDLMSPRDRRRNGKHRSAGSGGELQDLVVITGMSGAGKSEAMACFEDAGYFCVDNLPPQMIGSLADLLAHEGAKVERAAVVSDARGGTHFEQFREILTDLDRAGLSYRVLFLDADDQTLVNRFKETRRRHPLAPSGAIADGIKRERELFRPLASMADFVVDTTDMSAVNLRRHIVGDLLPVGTPSKLSVTFATYGFKHGPPRNVDLAFDVRFLPNPHYVEELRPLTGLDEPVRDYVAKSEGINEFYDRLVPLLDFLFDAYSAEGKSHLTVGVGCTGGRHRSVAIAEHLANLYRKRTDCTIDISHRDIDKPPRVG